MMEEQMMRGDSRHDAEETESEGRSSAAAAAALTFQNREIHRL